MYAKTGKQPSAPAPQALTPTLSKGNHIFDSASATCRIQSRDINPEGIPSSSPGLAFFQPTLGNGTVRESTPTGLRQHPGSRKTFKPTQPFQGCNWIS